MVRWKESTKPRSLREEIEELKDEIRYGKQKKETKKKARTWEYPRKWKSPMKKSLKDGNKVLVFYLTKSGKLEKPKLLPIMPGEYVLAHGKPYDVHPKAFWTLGDKKQYRCLIIREIDRRPVSNMDWKKVMERGDLTDSDEILIRTVMKSILAPKSKEMNKALFVILGLGVVGVLIYLFTTA